MFRPCFLRHGSRHGRRRGCTGEPAHALKALADRHHEAARHRAERLFFDAAADALELLQKKKNLRLAKLLLNLANVVPLDVRSVGAESFLVQERDLRQTAAVDLKIVSGRHPSEDELKAMLFGWRAVKHVKSNAIVYAAKDRTLGVGAGQMSRVDSSRIAVWKAGEAGLDLNGSAVCSDAFFPFADGLIAAAEAGATAAIQPGGSKRDDEGIAAADERGMAMAFTGGRHFRH